MIDLVFENQTERHEWQEKFFTDIATKALAYLELGRPNHGRASKQVELGIQLVTPERSQELNLKHRQKDKPTDVLSFPLDDVTLAKYDILPLGDIFICPDVAVAQAKEHHVSEKEEMARLVVHGLLHLLGYDHPDDEVSGPRPKRRGENMIDLQEEILEKIRSTKSARPRPSRGEAGEIRNKS